MYGKDRQEGAPRIYQEREVWVLEHLWDPGDGEHPWLLGFHFSEIEGRVECIGVTIRSYLAVPEYVESLDATVPKWVPCPPNPRARVSTLTVKEGWLDLRTMLETYEGMAFRGLGAADRMGTPAPLSAKIVRRVPFGDALMRVKRADAKAADFTAKVVATIETDAFQDAAAHAFEYADKLAQPQRRGRRPRYTDNDLVRVAELYRAAYAAGSPSPTKDVAESLGIPRSTTAKLVMRARERGLLGSTSQRRAGGVVPKVEETKGGES